MSNLLIITGSTATGKTKLGIELAKEFNGEILSADSRQVYKFMDIGTGKDLPKFSIFNFQFSNRNLDYGFYEVEGVKIWGLDIVEPDYHFNVADWVEYAMGVIGDIRNRGKLPIIVGGTGQYIRTLLEPPETMNIPPNLEIRNELLSYKVSQLQSKLQKIDKNRWERMNESDRQNPRRLVRAIEIAAQIQNSKFKVKNFNLKFTIDNILIIGLTADYDYLYKRIDQRVEERIEQGVIKEIQDLLQKGYSWDLPSMSGMGYQEFSSKLKVKSAKLTKEELKDIIQRWKWDEHNYARRQMTYLKKYFVSAQWFDITKADYKEQIRSLVAGFV